MSLNKQPIPAPIKNIAKGGYVTGAVDILDEELNKPQSQVNSETNAKFSQMDDEIEALESQDVVPVDSLPAVGSADPKKIYRVVGSTSYADYMVNAAGDGWKELAAFTFPGTDSFPEKDSLNIVTSGGIFNNLGALDISELNATENPHTLATYADLSAALAAIPSDYQKGGMSIKFVQSSDNKYVQYRYIGSSTAAADFTNIANWQGVDDEPTAGSDNLVKSGGIAREIDYKELTVTANAATSHVVNFMAGCSYHISVTSGCILSTRNDPNGDMVESIGSPINNSSIDFTPTLDAKYLRVGAVNSAPTTITIEVRGMLYDRVLTKDKQALTDGEKTQVQKNIGVDIVNLQTQIEAFNSDNAPFAVVDIPLKLAHGTASSDYSMPMYKGQTLKVSAVTTSSIQVEVKGTVSGTYSTIGTITSGTSNIESILTLDISAVRFYIPSTATDVDTNLNISKGNYNVRRIYPLDVDIDFKFADGVIHIPYAHTMFNDKSIEIFESNVNLPNSQNGYLYVLQYNISTNTASVEQYGINTTFGSNVIALAIFRLPTVFGDSNNIVYGINRYKINGEAYSPQTLSYNGVDLTQNFSYGKVITPSSMNIGDTVALEEASNSGWCSYKCDVSKGDTFVVSGYGGSSVRGIFHIDNSSKLVYIEAADTTLSNQSIVIPCDGTLVFNSANNVFHALIKKYIQGKLFDDKLYLNATRKGESLENPLLDDIQKGNFKRLLTIQYTGGRSYFQYFDIAKGEFLKFQLHTSTTSYNISLHFIKKDGTNTDAFLFKSVADYKLLEYSIIADDDYIGVCVYFASAANEGTAYINITSHYQIYDNFYNLGKGKCQFGELANCDYTPDVIPRVPWGESGDSQNFLETMYELYDDLAEAYPDYITKVDCDEEAIAAGITRPAYMEDYPIYMYKFIPSYPPSTATFNADDSIASRLKLFITTGTHPEFTSIWDCYQLMKSICESWDSEKNLEDLRWNVDIYVMPCSGSWGIANNSRPNYNHVDLNRNCPTRDWKNNGYTEGKIDWTGDAPASEYETKVFMHYINAINPDVYIDHHNANAEGVNKNLMYGGASQQWVRDVASAVISQMTRKWKKEYTDVFPSNSSDPLTQYGFVEYDHIVQEPGKRQTYAYEKGIVAITFETNRDICYRNGVYNYPDYMQTRTSLVATCATDAFANFVIRLLKQYCRYMYLNKDVRKTII